jgi:molybdopterin-containing oxidoreductase family iron-sulfur binding subunit
MKHYWKGLKELGNDPEFVKQQQNEFPEYIPVEEFIADEQVGHESSTSRRDFLKFLGFSAAAATLAACEAPVTKAIPYVIKPVDLTPGVANWYASTYSDGHDYASILVKTREGRPIKIEGNTLSKVTWGGVNARVHASLLSLYDSNRLKYPKHNGKVISWGDVDKMTLNGEVRLVTGTVNSPSTLAAIEELKKKYPTTKHIQYDAISYSGIRRAHGGVTPTFHLDKAAVIVSLGADFLTNWISPIEHTKQYVTMRKVNKDHKEMSKFYAFEAILSLTGANADERIPVKPSELNHVALALAGESNKLSAAVKTKADEVKKALDGAHGKAIVLSGSNDPAVQMVVKKINESLGAYESGLIDTKVADMLHNGDDEAFANFAKELEAGTVGTVIFWGCNPAYTAPKKFGAGANKTFAEILKGAKATKITFSGLMDETTELCEYVLPDHHSLESWNDYNPRTNQYSLQQPVITPLYGTRQAQESILRWAGNSSDYYSYIGNYWKTNMFTGSGTFENFWNQSLHDGVFEKTEQVMQLDVVAVPNNAAGASAHPAAAVVAPAAAQPAAADTSIVNPDSMTWADAVKSVSGTTGSGDFELVIYQKTSIGSGVMSNNPWLQELPDPITKLTWDNYITMHPLDVNKLKLLGTSTDVYGDEVFLVRYDALEDDNDIVTVTVNGQSYELPVWPQPGQVRGTIGIAVGYGRTAHLGQTVCDPENNNAPIGVNIYQSLTWTNGAATYDVFSGVSVSAPTGKKHRFATTQSHNTIMGRSEGILHETTLGEYKKDDRAGNEEVELKTYGGMMTPDEVNLWDSHPRDNHKWGMAIDLNSCIGCGACVVSCTAENNVPVVGKIEIRRSREMHWIRIDRYYSSDATPEDNSKYGTKELYRRMENPTFDNPKVVFQPMMCQHCNHAPCETVCPVLATSHSTEGLNQMTYNRCVGTRYCANNCPYKVRRFNWFNYTEYHRFKGINPTQDDIGRMVLNPDVTVRTRGVMEKCSMCAQRIQAGKLEAKKTNRRPLDGEIKTACQQSCPADSIVFGDLNDPNSAVSKMNADSRKFEVLEEVGTQPSVFYMTKVWNRPEEEHKAADKKEEKAEAHS